MPNAMAALPNIAGILCSTSQSSMCGRMADIQSATAGIMRGKKERKKKKKNKQQGGHN